MTSTPEDKHEEEFDYWTKVGSGHPQEVAFVATPGHWEASDVQSSQEKCDENTARP